MTRLYDGKKIAEITMCIWDGNGWTPDWSNDFYDIGLMEYDEDHDAYKVDDVDYCIEQAMDWKNSIGDFCNDVPNENNEVWVEIDNDPDDMRGAVRFDDDLGCWVMTAKDGDNTYTLTMRDGVVDINY